LNCCTNVQVIRSTIEWFFFFLGAKGVQNLIGLQIAQICNFYGDLISSSSCIEIMNSSTYDDELQLII
jgi:hypothetical protein